MLTTIEQTILLGLVPIAWFVAWLAWFRPFERELANGTAHTSTPGTCGEAVAQEILVVVDDLHIEVIEADSVPFEMYDPWQRVIRLSRRVAEGQGVLDLWRAALACGQALVAGRWQILAMCQVGIRLGARLATWGAVLVGSTFLLMSLGDSRLLLEGLFILDAAVLIPVVVCPLDWLAWRQVRNGLQGSGGPQPSASVAFWSVARGFFPASR